jgi:hypothetical protein
MKLVLLVVDFSSVDFVEELHPHERVEHHGEVLRPLTAAVLLVAVLLGPRRHVSCIRVCVCVCVYVCIYMPVCVHLLDNTRVFISLWYLIVYAYVHTHR